MVISQKSRALRHKTAFYILVSEKRLQLLPLHRRPGKLEGKKKKKIPLHQSKKMQCSLVSETLGFPQALNKRLVLIFQKVQKEDSN